MMGKVRQQYWLGLVVALMIGVGIPFVFHTATASAGVVRGPKNGAEADRMNQCNLQPYTIYGVVWINDVPTTNTTDARWQESMNITWDATFVDATMWSDAYNCPTGSTRTGSEVYNLGPAAGGQVPVTFPYGNSIYRGDSNPREFTDPPGSLRIRLDLTGRSSGCYSVAYTGTYRDSRGTGASTTYFTTVCINRASPPPELTCVAVSVNPATPEPGQPFRSTVMIRNKAGTQPYNGGQATVSIAGPAPLSGPSPPPPYPVPVIPGGQSRTISTTPSIVANTPGQYTVTWTVSGGNAPPITCMTPLPFKFRVMNRPYFRVYGGDVLAGMSGFGTCAASPGSGRILAYGRADGAGAGGQLAVMAMERITDFSSAIGSGSAPTPPKGLSFANNNASDPYGGNFGPILCNKDYFANTGNPITGGSFNPSQNSAVGPYRASTDLTINAVGGGGGLDLEPGRKLIIFVDGDVNITRNIKFKDDIWSNPNDIPQFWIVAKGNIYIQPNVEQLDGVYIAQTRGDGSKGRIFTCANGFAPPATGNSFFSNCQNKLTVNGTFIAQHIHLLRTRGTLQTSSNGEPANSDNIAEVFNFSPEVWMSPPRLPKPGGGGTDYDAITSLPPVL